jgi:beta-galactosidase
VQREETSASRDVRLVPGGLSIGGRLVPLLAGAVHYWRLDPHDWRACLEATKALGLHIVDVYVPWGIHEIAPGVLDLGQRDPRLDVAEFLRLAQEVGLYAIVRPGPHINAELTYFGLPERIVWDRSCQARTPKDNPVMLPMVPFAFPVPSYASTAFHDETARFFRALAPVIAKLRYPDGPIVMFQVDNEGALYFRDGAYDQDYHPDAIALYREFLRDKYKTLEALELAYGLDATSAEPVRFATIAPPTRFDAKTAADLARHVDWCEFHEHLLGTALTKIAHALADAGLDGLPTSHNLPPGQETTPLNAATIKRAVDLVGLDYYLPATPKGRFIIARRTTELAVRCDADGTPPFACEMGAGFPPFFPPLDERDSAFTLMTALAYGLRGFNLYMAVERDRWIGAPIDPHGRPRPFAAFFRRLLQAIEATRFYELHRRAPVRLVTPRAERRIARAMHAFGPFSGAAFSVSGQGSRESAREDTLDVDRPIAIVADTFARTVEAALEMRGVPFANVGGEDRDASLEGAAWIVCATSGGLSPRLREALETAVKHGTRVTFGPIEPTLDGALRPLTSPWDHTRVATAGSVIPTLVADDAAAVAAVVGRAIDELSLPAFACDADGIFATVHEDASGKPRVVFLINPTDHTTVARVALGLANGDLVDALGGDRLSMKGGTLEATLPAKSVRMLSVVTTGSASGPLV